MFIINMARSVLAYRGFIFSNIKREFQSKYQNSLLGSIWNIINPLSMIIVYTIIFSQIMRAKLPGIDHAFAYSIYLCAGVLTWGLFSEIVGKSQTVFIDNANLIKKVNFPRICLPITIVLNALLNFSIVFSIFSLFLVISGNFPGWVFFAIIPVLMVLALFSIGLGITLGVMNVFFRDIGQMFNIILQFWFWLTPIVYPISIIPERFHSLIHINPLAGVIEAAQSIFVKAEYPNWSSLLPALILGIILTSFGMKLFKTNVGEMVDEL